MIWESNLIVFFVLTTTVPPIDWSATIAERFLETALDMKNKIIIGLLCVFLSACTPIKIGNKDSLKNLKYGEGKTYVDNLLSKGFWRVPKKVILLKVDGVEIPKTHLHYDGHYLKSGKRTLVARCGVADNLSSPSSGKEQAITVNLEDWATYEFYVTDDTCSIGIKTTGKQI